MKLLRKVLAVLGILLLLQTTACGLYNPDDTAKKLNVEVEETVTIWYCNDIYGDYLKYVATRFKSLNELISFDIVKVETDDFLTYIYDESVRNENAPDIYIIDSHDLAKASQMGIALENNAYGKNYTRVNYTEAAIEASMVDDKLYGYPLGFNVPFMVYNKDVAEPVDTFAQLEEYCNNYQVTEDNKGIKRLVYWDVTDYFQNYAFSLGAIGSMGNSLQRSEFSIDKDALITGLSAYASFEDKFDIKAGETDSKTVAERFAQGEIAYGIIEMDDLSIIDASDVNYGVCAIPAVSEELKNSILSRTSLAVVNVYADNHDVSKAVANAMSFDYSVNMLDKSGILSARKVSFDKKYQETYGNIFKIYENSEARRKSLGKDLIYIKYQILLENVYSGKNVEEAVDAFILDVSN